MSMKKRLIVAMVVLVAVLLAAVGVTYAFFAQNSTISGKQNLTLVQDTDQKGTVTINSAYDLKVWARDTYYNVSTATSDKDARYVLILGNNIVLDEDIVIERDVVIVLNGNQLDLRDHTVTVRHGYVSRQYITNERYGDATPAVAANAFGTGSGKLVYDTPNAVVVIDEALQAYKVANGQLSGKIDILTFDEDLLIKNINQWIAKRVPAGKSYVSDIDLPTAFLGYSYRVQWQSSLPTVVDPSGKVFLENLTADILGTDTRVEVALNYQIINADGEVKFDTSTVDPVSGKTQEIKIFVLSPAAQEHRYNIGAAFVLEYFDRFKATNGDYYNLFLNIGLPEAFQYYGLSFAYRTFVKDPTSGQYNILSTNTDIKKGDGAPFYPDNPAELPNDGYVSAAGGAYLNWPQGARELQLQVKIVDTAVNEGQAENAAFSNVLSFDFVAVDGNNSNYSQAVLEKIGVIIIDNQADTIINLLSAEDKIKYNIKSVTYGFINADGSPNVGADGKWKYYDVATNEITTEENGQQVTQMMDQLYVKTLPSFEEEVFLTMTFEFEGGRPKEITVTSQVFYVDASMGGGAGGADIFAVYHSLLLQEYRKVSNYGETFRTFSLPRKIGKPYVRYYFDPKSVDAKADGTAPNQDVDDEVSAYGGRIVLKYTADMATFMINEALADQNLTVSIYLKYAQEAQPDWSTVHFYGQKEEAGVIVGTPIVMDLKLLGLLRNGIDTADVHFYDFLKTLADLDTDGYITLDEILQADITSMTISIASNASYTKFASYKGLSFFIQLTKLTITTPSFGASADDIAALSKLLNLKMLSIVNTATAAQTASNPALTAKDTLVFALLPNLVSLTLKNFNLADETVSGVLIHYDFNGNTKLQELYLINCALSDLSGLSMLPSLHKLHVNNQSGISTNANGIRKFEELRKLTVLEEVYVFGNVIAAGTDGGKFGSGGAYNLSVFVMLAERGVKVYRTEGVVFAPTASETEGAYVVEAIVYASTAKIVNGNIAVTVPVKLYLASADTVVKYTLGWKLIGQNPPTMGDVADYTFTLPATSGEKFEFVVSVTIGTTVVEKVIEVRAIA